MKIHGEQPGMNRASFTLRRAGGRAWILKLQALPYGFTKRNLAELPDPRAPIEVLRDGRGRVLRDEERRVLTALDVQDPTYRAEVERVRQLRLVHAFVVGLAGDPDVVFDAQREKFASTRAWVEALDKEIPAAGISDAELVQVVDRVALLNAGLSDRIEEVTEDFLPGTPSDSPGESPTAQDAAGST